MQNLYLAASVYLQDSWEIIIDNNIRKTLVLLSPLIKILKVLNISAIFLVFLYCSPVYVVAKQKPLLVLLRGTCPPIFF